MMINIYHPVSIWLNSFRREHENNPKKSFILLMCRFLVDFFFHPIGKSFTLNKHETVAATPLSPSQHSLIILKFEFNCSNRSHLWVKYFGVSFQRWWNYSAVWIWFPLRINHPWTKTSQRSAVVLGDIRLAASDQKIKRCTFSKFPCISSYFPTCLDTQVTQNRRGSGKDAGKIILNTITSAIDQEKRLILSEVQPHTVWQSTTFCLWRRPTEAQFAAPLKMARLGCVHPLLNMILLQPVI